MRGALNFFGGEVDKSVEGPSDDGPTHTLFDWRVMVRQAKSFAMGAFLMFVGMGLVYGAPFAARTIVPASDELQSGDATACEDIDGEMPDGEGEGVDDPQECESDDDQDADGEADDDEEAQKQEDTSEEEDDGSLGESDDKGEHGRAVRIVAHCDVSGRAHGELVRSIATNKTATVEDAEKACADAISESPDEDAKVKKQKRLKPSHDNRKSNRADSGDRAGGGSNHGSDTGADHDSGNDDHSAPAGGGGGNGQSGNSHGGKNKSKN
jgi:hypothetical protein